MKKIYVLAAAMLMASSPTSYAAEGQTFAVVNIQQIMKDSTAAKSVREQLESKQKTFQAEITKKEEQLKKEDQELAKQRSVLAKEAFEEKARTFRTKATDMQKEVQSKKAMLDNGFERALGDIQKVVSDIIVELAKEKGFSMAIPTSQILYADPKMDISAEVLEKLNKKLPKVDVKFEK